MKARDYAKKFNDNETIETFTEICNSFIRECGELLRVRHATSDAAAIAVFKEQDQKWKAFCNLVDGVKPEVFRLLVQEQFPAVFVVMGWGGTTLRAVDMASPSINGEVLHNQNFGKQGGAA